MADVFSRRKRSEIMSRVRGKGNRATELAFVAILRKFRIKGWRRNADIFGSPDIIFPKHHLAIFVDGCFWHGCARHKSQPATNREFWRQKLDGNKIRDRLVCRTLKKQGWCVLRVWQHDLSRKKEKRLVRRITKTLVKVLPTLSGI